MLRWSTVLYDCFDRIYIWCPQALLLLIWFDFFFFCSCNNSILIFEKLYFEYTIYFSKTEHYTYIDFQKEILKITLYIMYAVVFSYQSFFTLTHFVFCVLMGLRRESDFEWAGGIWGKGRGSNWKRALIASQVFHDSHPKLVHSKANRCFPTEFSEK